MATAAARAAHLVVDREPWLFEDRLAAALLGDAADDLLAAHREPAHADILASLRVAMTTRSRYTEERLSEAARRGIEQCVLLGAGLDSFAYRAPVARQLRVFEVDHPATQAWKVAGWRKLRFPFLTRFALSPSTSASIRWPIACGTRGSIGRCRRSSPGSASRSI
jgi:methyltransferase (TIGR00027 family)